MPVALSSFFAEREKVLYGNCCGNFLTEPSGVALPLSDILQLFSHILPHRAIVVINGDVSDSKVLELESEIVTLYGTTIEYSVIATALDGNSSQRGDSDKAMVVSLPNDLKIKVAAVDDQPDDDEMFQKTRDIFESFDLSNVKDLRRPLSSSTRSSQLHFYEEIGRGSQTRRSVELKKPERVYEKLETSSKLSL